MQSCLKLYPTLVLSLFAMSSLTSCGLSKDAGLSLGVSLSPSKAFIVPGTGASCVALAVAKKDQLVPVSDVSGERVLFNRFALQWRSNDKLTIAGIKATIFSSGITGADTDEGLTISFSEDEIAALLGLQATADIAALTLPFIIPPLENPAVNIDSTSTTSKGASSPYAPCGLQIGGLSSKPSVKSFSARIRIEVSGYKTACVVQQDGSCKDGELSPVRQSVTVSAEKF